MKEKINVIKLLKNLLLVIVGTLVLAFGSAIFIIPYDLVCGGVSGIAIVLDKVIGNEYVTVDLIVTVLTWLLFFVGAFVLGKSFAMKTLVSTIVYPVALSLFMRLSSSDFLGGFLNITQSEYSQIAIILASIFGGFCIGAGCAITFLGGGSTGGIDIIAFVICKIFKRAKSSVVIFLLDASTVVLGMFVIRDLVISLLGITSAFVCAIVVDKVFLGSSRAFIAQIITEKSDELNREITADFDRTSTVFDVVGGYTGKARKMIMVSFTMSQYAELLAIINRVDKYAFTTIHSAHEIKGEGWSSL